MADNVEVKAAATLPVAARSVTYSGDAAQLAQAVGLVGFSGSDDAKTVTDIPGDASGLYHQGAVAHDAPAAGNPVLLGAYAKAAAPSDVSTDADAVRLWALKNGCLVINLAAAGALIPGDVTNGLDVDVTRTGEGIADDAGFTVATSRVIPAGLLAVAHGSNPDAADALDAVIGLTNRHRVPFVVGGHPNVLTLKHTTITTAVSDVAMITVSAGSKIVVTRITITLDNASTVFPTILIGFGTSATPTTTGVLYSHGGFPAGGGQSVGDGSGIIGIGADDQDLRITTTGNATGNGLQITVSYYTIES